MTGGSDVINRWSSETECVVTRYQQAVASDAAPKE